MRKAPLTILVAALLMTFVGCESNNSSTQKKSTIRKPFTKFATAAKKVGPVSMWTTKFYVDEFGDLSNTKYMTTKKSVYGTFSNSATEGSRLRVHILIGLDADIDIMLYEYDGRNPVKSYGEDKYKIYVKTNDGITHTMAATNYGDRISFKRWWALDLHQLFLKHRTLKFYIVAADYRQDKYSFEVSAIGYTATFNELERAAYK